MRWAEGVQGVQHPHPRFALEKARTLSELVFLSFSISPGRRNRRETEGVYVHTLHTLGS